MIAFFLAPIYILVNYYILWRLLHWMGSFGMLFQHPLMQFFVILIYIFFASSLLTSFLVKHPAWLQRLLKHVSNYFLGTLLYILMTLLAVEGLGLLLKYGFHISWLRSSTAFAVIGFFAIVLILFISLSGVFHRRRLQLKHYEITIPKTLENGPDSLKIVLLADTHFGYTINEKTAAALAEQINAVRPDLICFAGDIFDNDFDAMKSPLAIQEALKSLQSTYGTYACWGNHDLNEPILAGFTFHHGNASYEDPRMTEFLKEAGIQLLEDEYLLINNQFYLVGRKDPARAKKMQDPRMEPAQLLAPLDASKPIIVMDHQPKQLRELSLAGADLDLCGHTHDGQLFPGNILTSLMWENSCGYCKKDQMHNIVTSGVGIWGPNMRVGTTGEICVINVHLQSDS